MFAATSAQSDIQICSFKLKELEEFIKHEFGSVRYRGVYINDILPSKESSSSSNNNKSKLLLTETRVASPSSYASLYQHEATSTTGATIITNKNDYERDESEQREVPAFSYSNESLVENMFENEKNMYKYKIARKIDDNKFHLKKSKAHTQNQIRILKTDLLDLEKIIAKSIYNMSNNTYN